MRTSKTAYFECFIFFISTIKKKHSIEIECWLRCNADLSLAEENHFVDSDKVLFISRFFLCKFHVISSQFAVLDHSDLGCHAYTDYAGKCVHHYNLPCEKVQANEREILSRIEGKNEVTKKIHAGFLESLVTDEKIRPLLSAEL